MAFKWLQLSCLGLMLMYSMVAQAALRIGVIFYDPPLVMSSIQGFNVDLANTICKGLETECLIVPMVWSQLFKSLDNNQIDLILGAYITAERARKYIFSNSYMPSEGRIIARLDSKLTSIGQLKNMNVGIIKEEEGTGVFFNYIQDNLPNLFKIVEFQDIETLLTALDSKVIQAGFMHSTAVNYWINNSSDIFRPLGPTFEVGQGYGILALPNKQILIDNINEQITIIKANGTFNKIYQTYFN